MMLVVVGSKFLLNEKRRKKFSNKLFATDILSDLMKCLNVIFELSSKMNTTTMFNNQTLPPNYCVLPTQHSHSFPRIFLQDLVLDEEDGDSILNGQVNIVNHDDQNWLISQLSVSRGDINGAENKIKRSAVAIQPGVGGKNGAKSSSMKENSLTALESILDHRQEIHSNYHNQQKQQPQQQQLDPYIDAVQVKSRINNKRGARVKALGNPRDHEPNPSYYSKTVHVETSKEEHDEYDHDDEDWETDDEHDDYHHHDAGDHKKGHHLGHDQKKVYKVKAYLGDGKKKRKKEKKKNKHYYYLHGPGKHGALGDGYGKYANKYGGKGKGKRGGKKKGYKKKKKVYGPKKKKVTYAYMYKKPKGKQYYEVGHDYDHHHHDKYNHGAEKYKMVHMDHHQLMDHHHKGGKMSIAGLLGYTLLCVNYLLVLKQPTYDKYNSHGYTKYSPKHHSHQASKGELVHVKGGGPVILAHCAELPSSEQQQQQQQQQLSSSLKPSFARSNDNIGTTNTTTCGSNLKLMKPIDYFMSKQQSNLTSSLDSSETSYYHSDDDHSSALYYLRNNARSSNAGSPPAYYYTLSPSYGSNQYSVGLNSYNNHAYSDYETPSAGGGSLLSPIQNYLNRLLMPASMSQLAGEQQYNHHDDHSDDNYAPIRVVGSPRARLVTNTIARGNLANIKQANRFSIGSNGNTLGVNNARLIVIDPGQPQVVGQRDNLIDLRSRQVDIQVHVIRRKFTGAQQLINLPEEADFLLARQGNLGVQVPVAVRAPDGNSAAEQMQADQPATTRQQDNNNSSSSSQILDLPEYALNGDSIELTCNHRIPISRLYSVKWFKDSLEFYRYIPANGARSKSSLFLPDVRLDLARSNSQMLYLRNVTHRTSGLYRCEVVSGK